jgi:hypothetical protein
MQCFLLGMAVDKDNVFAAAYILLALGQLPDKTVLLGGNM